MGSQRVTPDLATEQQQQPRKMSWGGTAGLEERPQGECDITRATQEDGIVTPVNDAQRTRKVKVGKQPRSVTKCGSSVPRTEGFGEWQHGSQTERGWRERVGRRWRWMKQGPELLGKWLCASAVSSPDSLEKREGAHGEFICFQHLSPVEKVTVFPGWVTAGVFQPAYSCQR